MRRDVASALASSGITAAGRGARREPVEEIDLTVLRRAVRAHPVHGCADREEHLQWARRWRRLTVENDALAAKVATATGSLGKALEEIIGLLTERGYLRGRPAHRRRQDAGADLVGERPGGRRMPAPRDLGRAGPAPELAAVVSAWSSNPAGRSPGAARTPSGVGRRRRMLATTRVWAEITARERALGLPPTRDPDPGSPPRWRPGAGAARWPRRWRWPWPAGPTCQPGISSGGAGR